MARSARLKRKQKLKKEEALLKARKEQLDLETEIAAKTAKLSIIKGYEASHVGGPQSMDMMNEYLESGLVENLFDEDGKDVHRQAHALLINTDMETHRRNVDIQKQSSSPKLNVDQRTSTVR